MTTMVRENSRKLTVAALAIGLCLVGAIPASATITFELGNNPQQPDEQNVLFGPDTETGNLVIGQTNQSGDLVNFTSPTTITDPSSGQARVEGSPESIGINSLTIAMADSALGYSCLIINPFLEQAVGTFGAIATVTVSSVDANGDPEADSVFQYELAQGENFLTIVAEDGEVITSTTISLPEGSIFHDLRQPRLCPEELPGPGPSPVVPEPASMLVWSMLLGCVGLAIWRRRKAA